MVPYAYTDMECAVVMLGLVTLAYHFIHTSFSNQACCWHGDKLANCCTLLFLLGQLLKVNAQHDPARHAASCATQREGARHRHLHA